MRSATLLLIINAGLLVNSNSARYRQNWTGTNLPTGKRSERWKTWAWLGTEIMGSVERTMVQKQYKGMWARQKVPVALSENHRRWGNLQGMW